MGLLTSNLQDITSIMYGVDLVARKGGACFRVVLLGLIMGVQQ